jgi:hypothetical protein
MRTATVPIRSSYGQKTEPPDTASCRLLMIVAQRPTQSLAALHRPFALMVNPMMRPAVFFGGCTITAESSAGFYSPAVSGRSLCGAVLAQACAGPSR